MENEKIEPSICIVICQILNRPNIRMISVCTSQYDQKILPKYLPVTSVLFQSQRFCFTNDHLINFGQGRVGIFGQSTHVLSRTINIENRTKEWSDS
ncbi:unnamed protein product [Brugia timori]|uniref:Uncharacterized protein n=1 Tax=Brugia timori TaxID=42155 RepID=A0A3P7TKG6_9BILA|nr:unnamed protein product [Brugia timori]